MKKTLLALAAATVAGGAFAQSTVTLSGVVDLAASYTAKVAPGAANWGVGRQNNNRLAFAVSEDLGGGMRAFGNAQIRFEPGTGNAETSGGQQRPLFQGETRIGLAGGFGTVMLGRGLGPVSGPNGGYADPWGVTTVAGNVYAAGFLADYAAGGEGRIDRAIWYTTPSIAGLSISATYSPVKLTTAGVSKTFQGLNALYNAGALGVGIGQERNRGGDSITNLYGTYDLGVAKLHFSTARISGGTAAEQAAGGAVSAFGNPPPSGPVGTVKVAADGTIRNNALGLTVPMGAASVRVGYSSWNGSGAPGQVRDSKVGAGIRYGLSKRTYVYSDMANWTRKNNTGTNDSNNATRQTAFDLGVAHSF